MSEPPPDGPAFVGWSRPSAAARRVWRPVCEGKDEVECNRRLHDVIDAQGPGARDWVVLPGGRKPGERP